MCLKKFFRILEKLPRIAQQKEDLVSLFNLVLKLGKQHSYCPQIHSQPFALLIPLQPQKSERKQT